MNQIATPSTSKLIALAEKSGQLISVLESVKSNWAQLKENEFPVADRDLILNQVKLMLPFVKRQLTNAQDYLNDEGLRIEESLILEAVRQDELAVSDLPFEVDVIEQVSVRGENTVAPFVLKQKEIVARAVNEWPHQPKWLNSLTGHNSIAALSTKKNRPAPEGIDEEIWSEFCSEADMLLNRTTPIVQNSNIPYGELASVLKRDLHTLKGGARMMLFKELGDDIHELEQNLEAVFENSDADLWREWQKKFWAWSSTLESITKPEGSETASAIKVPPAWLDEWVQSQKNLGLLLQQFANGHLAQYKNLREQEPQIQQLNRHLRELEIHTDLQMQARRRELARQGSEFDALEMDRFDRQQELTRFLSEGLGDLQDTHQILKSWLQEQAGWITARQTNVRQHYQQLLQARLISFGTVQERFQRLVGQVASELGKQVRIDFVGMELEIDRALLERMIAPLEHLLRNSLAHGIELPADRESSGKPVEGLLQLSVRADPQQITLVMEDDGKGLQWSRIEEKARSLGWVSKGQVIEEDFLIDCLFRPGFSTAEVVSQVAGRGVGMDVVRSEIIALGGHLKVTSRAGLGLKIAITLPNNVSGIPILVMRTESGQMWGIKKQDVVSVVEVEDGNYELNSGLQEDNVLRFGNKAIVTAMGGENKKVVSLHVQDVLGIEEVMVQPVAIPLQRSPGIRGACILVDGSLAWLIEPWDWLAFKKESEEAKIETEKSSNKILVVDDSLTMRRAAERILLSAGYEVVEASDGQEALTLIAQQSFAAVLLDVEMPRLDGFEVLKSLRMSEETKNLPVAMITSRTAAKHKEYAMGLGANVYFGKPYRPQDLLSWLSESIK